MTFKKIYIKYLWIVLIIIVLGFTCGFILRGTGIRDTILGLTRGASVEISDETDIIPVDNGTFWLGLRVKTKISGEEKVTLEDYSLRMKIPGFEGEHDLLPSRDGKNYVLPLWPPSDPGEYLFLITTNDNVNGNPFEYPVVFPGITKKESLLKSLSDGQFELVVDGMDFKDINDAYHTTGSQMIEPFPKLRENGGIFDAVLSSGSHVFIFRMGDQWYYTNVEVADSGIQTETGI